MDGRRAEELRRLRVRAYGPDADIAADRPALLRLRELEAEAAGTAHADTLPAEPTAEASPAAQVGHASAEALIVGTEAEVGPTDPRDQCRTSDPPGVSGDGDASRPPDDVRRRGPDRLLSRLRRLSLRQAVWLWIASAAVIAFAASAVTMTVGVHEVRQIAVLQVDEEFVAPGYFGFDSEHVIGYRSFSGLTAIRVDGEWVGLGSGRECLYVIRTEDVDAESDALSLSFSAGGPVYGCTAGDLPALIQLEVTEEAPEELRQALPGGTGLQFVLDGDRVIVRVAA